MFEVTIYYKDGRRSMLDHVVAVYYNVTNINIKFLTDFDDEYYRSIDKDTIESINIKIS